jgi:hypothetical protein
MKLIPFVEENKDKLDWNILAIEMLEENMDKLNEVALQFLASNPNPDAIHLLEQNIAKFDDNVCCSLIDNPNAMKLLQQNLDKLDDDAWYMLKIIYTYLKRIQIK